MSDITSMVLPETATSMSCIKSMVLPETATSMSNQMTTSETMRRIIGDADNQIRVVVFVAIDYSVKLNHTFMKLQ
jgi:hypothetical protein